MFAVSELITDVADVMEVPRETVNAYARALIDAALLPKSRGRAVAIAEPVHIIRLFMAVALAPKIRETAEVVERYGALKAGGIPDDWPISSSDLESFLVDIWTVVMTNDDEAARPVYREANIEFVENWDEVTVRFPEIDKVVRFTASNDHGTHWHGFFKRSGLLHARAFVMLGDKAYRDYATGVQIERKRAEGNG